MQNVDARVKQAIINSKTQAFKNHNIFKNEAKKATDQIARPAEVQVDVSNDARPPSKEFSPSPEVSPLYTRENEPREHFSPMNHFYRPTKPDAQFPTETSFSANPTMNTRWLGGDREPMRSPMDFMQPPGQFQQGRNTNVDYPFYHAHGNQFHQQFHHQHRHASEEKINFPSDESGLEEPRGWPDRVPALNFKKTKGSWKWVPDEDSSSGEPESHTFPPSLNSFESSSPQTTRDRPYSFESNEPSPFGNFFHPSSSPLIGTSRLPTGPAAWSSSGSETLLSTEEYQPSSGGGKHGESGKNGNLDIKLTR